MAAILAKGTAAFSRWFACDAVGGGREGLSGKVDSDPGFIDPGFRVME
jgi:hypothetical protein